MTVIKLTDDIFGKPLPMDQFEIVDAEQLMKEPKRENKWLVNNLLHAAGTSLWAGKPKVGKTTLVRQLALSVAQGKEFLGREATKGTVFYLALEEDRDEIKEHLADMGCPEGEPNLLFHVGAIKGNNPIEALTAFVEDVQPSLVILDTLAKFTRLEDLNNYAMVIKCLGPITELARKNDCHILFVHHMNKGQFAGHDKILGSVGITGEVDTIVTMTTDERDRYIETVQRYGRPLPKHMLEFDEKTRLYTITHDKVLF